MITINEKYSFERDPYCWHLHEKYEGKDKKGNSKLHTRTTYHSNLGQILNEILDRECGRCENISELKDLLEKAQDKLPELIEQIK